MRKRRLPRRYARELFRHTRSNFFSKSIGWKQFLSLMEQKEATILWAYTTLCLSKSGTLHKNQILTSLKGAGLPANEDNAAAMLRYLNSDSKASISYGHFRNFMLLLPSERLEDDPRYVWCILLEETCAWIGFSELWLCNYHQFWLSFNIIWCSLFHLTFSSLTNAFRNIWFEAATVVAVPPPIEISTGSVLKSALAGGLASALSTSLLHPIDSMKVQYHACLYRFSSNKWFNKAHFN